MTTYERLKQILVSKYQLAPEKLTPDARLEELGVDSLGVMELLFQVEDEFSIRLPSDQVELPTIGDVVDYIDRLVAEQHADAAPVGGVLPPPAPSAVQKNTGASSGRAA
ncbi:acyl carrier protein [Noviherbaspirillum sp.]|uniref:acyl carrier protein n=1 Tax=Noviherbaspirillum sp. TaxID=1926288 RepID=UPI002FE0A579